MVNNSIEDILKRLKEFQKWIPCTWDETMDEIRKDCKDLRGYLCKCDAKLLKNVVTSAIHSFFRLMRCDQTDLQLLVGRKLTSMRYTCLCILGSIFIPCFPQVDLRDCDEFSLGLVIENFPMICSIQELILPRFIESTFLLEDKIAVLRNLRKLTYNSSCTNQILSTVARFCPQLTYIDVSYSSQVDDSSVNNICQLPSLTVLYITKTSITLSGYGNILQNLPGLRNFSWKMPIDELMRDLPCQITNKFHCVDAKIESANMLCARCPNIMKLSITNIGIRIDLSILSRLRHLKYLCIYNFNFLTSKFGCLLQQSGQNLETLLIRSVVKVDFGTIVNNCSNLKSLLLRGCKFNTSSLVNKEDSSPHFKNLRLLELNSNFGVENFYNYIELYENIEEFHIANIDEFHDYFIINLVVKEVFKNLHTFYAIWCPLTQKTADFLIDNCDKLTTLGCLSLWEIGCHGIENLKTKVRNNNLGVTLDGDMSKTYSLDRF